MSIRVEFDAESEHLRIDATGTFSLVEAKRTFLEMLEALTRHKVKKMLFDGRKLTGEPETMERFFYGEFAAKTVWDFVDRGISPATRFAYVLGKPVLDPQKFGQIVAKNRGMTVEVFENQDDAFRWLGLTSSNKPDTYDRQKDIPNP